MFPLSRKTRARVAALVAVVLTALSVTVPLLDRGLDPGALALTEAGEAPGYVDHHHGVCLQHSAAAWTPAVGAELPTERFGRQDDAPCRAGVHTGGPSLTLHRSRAPPVV